jgi:hypothetical protein
VSATLIRNGNEDRILRALRRGVDGRRRRPDAARLHLPGRALGRGAPDDKAWALTASFRHSVPRAFERNAGREYFRRAL